MTDLETALRHAPILHFDRAETIPLKAVGYTVFRGTAESRSFPGRTVKVPEGAAYTVEYALFWLYDSQHMYDLEHIWVTADAEGAVLAAEGSFHGKVLNLLPGLPGCPAPENGHVHAFIQPGKHAVLANGELTKLFPEWRTACTEAGGPVLIGNPFSARWAPGGKDLFEPTAEDDANSLRYLREALSFEPTLAFTAGERISGDILEPWESLFEKIPGWIAEECRRLAKLYAEL